ncbi:myophilinmyophilin-like [Octopus vulgaris]|uniref:Myophilinmyophilin-like n=1 Tax=Octopus vulgaris TaxID=6645 RepID=A0AA36AKV3_OCTVU|nr:myophilinmyophilin-like [Octopus vulgaris]
MASKRNAEKEKEALDWIEAILGEPIDRKKPFEEVLKNGIILCNFINKLLPGSVKKIEKSGTGFVLMQNLERFQGALKKYGVPETEVFQTVDLYERKNIPQVVLCIYAIGRVAQTKPDFNGPILGPKMADENKREFTQEQLEAGKNVATSKTNDKDLILMAGDFNGHVGRQPNIFQGVHGGHGIGSRNEEDKATGIL